MTWQNRICEKASKRNSSLFLIYEMTKILVVTEQCWPEGGGGTLATHLIANILARHGSKVTIFTGIDQPSRIDRVEYLSTPYLKPRNKLELWLNLVSLAQTPSFLNKLREADILYVPRYCYPVIPLAKRLGKKVIVHLHDYQPIAYSAAILCQNGRRSGLLKMVKDNVQYELMEHRSASKAIASTLFAPFNSLVSHWLKEVDEIVCVSKKQAEIISGRLKVDVKVIYNPLPSRSIVTKEIDAPLFLYTGGTSYLKGIHVLLKASRKLLEDNRSTRFIVTKGLRNIWKRMFAGSLALASAYQILGWIEYEELTRLHASVRALIFPSIWEEPLPYAVSESMLHGTIPIASSVGGVSEIVQGSFAEKMLFQPGNADELLDKMNYALSLSKEQLADISLSLRESLLTRFNQVVIEEKLLRIFCT